MRKGVKSYALSQAQFEALVSFPFNVGANGARATLAAANEGAPFATQER